MFENRRKKQSQYILNVKVRTREESRRRINLGVAALILLVSVAVISYGMYRFGKYSLAKLLYENPRFNIAQIVLEDDGVLTSAQVIQLADVRVGQNLLAVDLDQTRRNLELVPIVRRICVRRDLPNRLVINIEERVALAKLNGGTRESDGSTFLVDRDGYVMKPMKLADGNMIQPLQPKSLPVLTGVKVGDMRVGRRVESEPIYQALALLDKLAQSSVCAAMEIEQIDLSRPRLLTVTTRQKTVVKLDPLNLPQQLRRLAVVWSWAQQHSKTAQMVDLTVDRGVPVTFVN